MNVVNAIDTPEIIKRAEGARRRTFLLRWGIYVTYGCIWALILILFALGYAFRDQKSKDIYKVLEIRSPTYDFDTSRFVVILAIMIISLLLFALNYGLYGRSFISSLVPLQGLPASKRASSNRLISAIESVAIATGRKPLACLIMPSSMPNAMAFILKSKPRLVVTSGLLDSELTQSEMTAVVAHESAHVAIGDALSWRGPLRFFFSLAACFLITICLFFLISPWFSHWQMPTSIILLMGALVILAMILIPVFAILQYKYSRQDDLFADAVAVMITRDPDALISSILKIATSEGGIDFCLFKMVISPLGAVTNPFSVRMSMAKYFFLNPLHLGNAEPSQLKAEIEQYFPAWMEEGLLPHEKQDVAVQLQRYYHKQEESLYERISALVRMKQGVHVDGGIPENQAANIMQASELE